jgi:phosphopantetheinyl transferase (holo-ACP synthase)
MKSKCDSMRDLTNDEFQRIVNADIRNQASSAEYECLRTDPSLVDRWHSTLTAMKKSVENQFSAKEAEAKALRAELEARGDHDGARQVLIDHLKWKAGVTRFKSGLEEKLAEASWRYREIGSASLAETIRQERNLLAQRNIQLKTYILQLLDKIDAHRDDLDEDDNFSKADLELWELAKEIRSHLPQREMVTLAKVILDAEEEGA